MDGMWNDNQSLVSCIARSNTSQMRCKPGGIAAIRLQFCNALDSSEVSPYSPIPVKPECKNISCRNDELMSGDFKRAKASTLPRDGQPTTLVDVHFEPSSQAVAA